MIRVLLRSALVISLISVALAQVALGLGHELPNDVIAYRLQQRSGTNDIFLSDLRTLSQINLTRTPKSDESHPVWSPDGSQIAYFRRFDQTNASSICIVDGKTRCYPAGTDSINDLRWSPDASKIVYSDSRFVFYTLDLRTDAAPNSSQIGVYPTYWGWSPDGSQLVFTTDTNRSGFTVCCAIYLANGDFSDLHWVYRGNLRVNSSPSWSPDGKQLLFGAKDTTSPSHLYLLNVDTAKTRTLSEFPDQNPSWSPDGTQIAFISDRSGSLQLYLMSADGASQRIVSEIGDWRQLQYAWSPDGSRILFMGNRPGAENQVFVLDLKSRQIQTIPSGGVGKSEVTWRP